MLAIMVIGFIIKTAYDPSPEPFNPLISHTYGVTQVQASEPIVQPPAFSSNEVVRLISELESNGGRNKDGLVGICERQGKSNIYGYGGMRLKICFDTPELAKARVTKWLIKYYDKFENDLGKTLCYYNLGLEQSDCTYYQNYLKLKDKGL